MNLEDKFPEWYAIVVPNFTAAQAESRLKAALAIAKGLKKPLVPQLVRMFYRLPVEEAYKNDFRQQLKGEDPQYVSNDEAELAIIAGAVIVSKLKESSNEADAIALAVRCVEAGGLRKSERTNDVVNQCQEYLVHEAVRVRSEHPKLPEFPDKTLAATIGKVKEKIGDLNTYSQAVEEQLLKLASSIRAQFDRTADLVATLERRRTEESNILYWLFGEATIEGRSPYSTMSELEATLPIAYDLASMMEDLPGPAGVRTFMRKMLRVSGYKDSGTASVADVVNSLKDGHRERYTPSKRVDDAFLMPVTFALEKSKESGGTDWLSAFKTQTLLDPKKKIGLIDLCDLFYTERLLLKALS